MQSPTMPSVLSPKPHILPTTATCMLSLAGPRQTHWHQVIYKSLLDKAPPYLHTLVTIAVPPHSTRSSRYISLVTPKANSLFGRLSFQFSAANDWIELQTFLLLTLCLIIPYITLCCCLYCTALLFLGQVAVEN